MWHSGELRLHNWDSLSPFPGPWPWYCSSPHTNPTTYNGLSVDSQIAWGDFVFLIWQANLFGCQNYPKPPTTITTSLRPSSFYNLRGVQGKKKSVSFGTSRSCLSEEVIFLWTRLELSSCDVMLPFLIVANYLFPLLGLSQGHAVIAPRQVQDSVTSKPWKPQSVPWNRKISIEEIDLFRLC